MMKNEKANTTESPNASRAYKRRVRSIIIHKPMQREFTFVIIGLLMVSTLAIGFVIHSTVREVAFGGGFHFGKINPYEMLSDLSYQLVARVTAILFITFIVIGIFGLFFLHRVAGPVYRFRQILLRINDGEIPKPIKLREGDFFVELAAEVNRILDRFRFEADRNKLLREKLDTIPTGSLSGSASQSIQELKALLTKEFRG